MSYPVNKAAFIDRDGTLIEEVNFLSRLEDLEIFPFTLKALTMLRENGFKIHVVTNQSGIGRGIYTEQDMHAIHQQMTADLPGLIDSFHFCPHLPDAGCRCRKPNTGMIDEASAGYTLDRQNSWMIGDKYLDVETGKNAGIRSALGRTGYGERTADTDHGADVTGRNLLEAVEMIVRETVRQPLSAAVSQAEGEQ